MLLAWSKSPIKYSVFNLSHTPTTSNTTSEKSNSAFDLVFLAKYNPIGYLIDSFNYMFVGAGSFDWMHIVYSGSFAIVTLFIGILIFNQVEKNFMDTV